MVGSPYSAYFVRLPNEDRVDKNEPQNSDLVL
jgi:hypothetical protein